MTRQYPLPLPHREAMAADDFMVTDSNREAVGWVDQWPQWPGPCLSLYGPEGCGKTHLMQVWLTKSRGRLLTQDDLKTVDLGVLTGNQALALDNAEAVAGHPDAEEALFHLYNRLKDAQGFLLLTATKAPAQWNLKLPDLKSRLTSQLAIAITAPDDDLLASLIIKQFRDRQIDIALDVVTYLLPRITRSPAAIRDLVTILDRTSLAEGRGISVALARRVLETQQDFLIS